MSKEDFVLNCNIVNLFFLEQDSIHPPIPALSPLMCPLNFFSCQHLELRISIDILTSTHIDFCHLQMTKFSTILNSEITCVSGLVFNLSLFSIEHKLFGLGWALANLFLKGQIVDILGFGDHIVSVVTTHFCRVG